MDLSTPAIYVLPINRKIPFTALLATTLTLTLAPAATARYWIGQGEAEHYARDYWHHVRGFHHTAAVCRPQYLNTPEPGYVYHSWTCAFGAGESSLHADCYGSMLISGSRTPGDYYHRVDYTRGDC